MTQPINFQMPYASPLSSWAFLGAMHVGNQVNCESRFFVSAQPICRSNRDLKIIARHPRKDTLDTHSSSHSLTRSVSQSVKQQAAGGEMDLPCQELQLNMAAHFANGMHATSATGNGQQATDNITVVHATLTSNKIKGKSQPITKITPTHQHKQTKWCGTRDLEPETRVRAQKAKNVAPKAPLHWYFKHCQGA